MTRRPAPLRRLAMRPACATFAAALVALIATTASAQTQTAVVVTLTRPPLNQLRVTDLYSVTAINTGRADVAVVLRGEISERRAGRLYEVLTGRVVLRPGANALRARDLEPITVPFQTSDTRIRDAIVRTSEPPAGEYRVCVYALDATSRQELGRDCYDQSVERLTPPDLILPTRGAIVEERQPTFSWTPPVPPPTTRTTYTIKIVEMTGGQTPEVALRTNAAVFELGRVPATALVYPASARPLRNARYAWAVTVIGSDGRTPVAQSRAESFEVRQAVVGGPGGPPVVANPPAGLRPPGDLAVAVPTLSIRQRLIARPCTAMCDPPSPNPPVVVVSLTPTAPNRFTLDVPIRLAPEGVRVQDIEQNLRTLVIPRTITPPATPPPSPPRGNAPGNVRGN